MKHNNDLKKEVINMSNFLELRSIENIEEHYELGALLGRGAFGTVRKVKRKVTDKICALKTIFKSSIKTAEEEELLI